MIRRNKIAIYQCVHKYCYQPSFSNSANSIPVKRIVEIFTADLIIYDDDFRAVGVYFDMDHPDTRKGPDITFSLANFSTIWENLKYRDLLPPLIRDNHLTAQLFGLTEVPAAHYHTFVEQYSKLKILVRDEKGRLRKACG